MQVIPDERYSEYFMNELEQIKKVLPFIWPLTEKMSYPIDILLEDLEKALARTPFDEKNQISLTALDQDNQDPYKFAGSLYSYETATFKKMEAEFSYFIDQYRDLIFYKIYLELQRYLPFQLGRMRLLKLGPHSCYSMHHDDGLRFHLALKTNPQCFICFKEGGAFHIPADGKIYGSNTMLTHTAINGSLEDRVHLVVSTTWSLAEGQKYIDQFTKNN